MGKRLPGGPRLTTSPTNRNDADHRGVVLHALMLDTLVPRTVDAKVDDGMVTLTGTANWHFQRDEAETVAANVRGVISVEDEVEPVAPGPTAHGLERRVRWLVAVKVGATYSRTYVRTA